MSNAEGSAHKTGPMQQGESTRATQGALVGKVLVLLAPLALLKGLPSLALHVDWSGVVRVADTLAYAIAFLAMSGSWLLRRRAPPFRHRLYGITAVLIGALHMGYVSEMPQLLGESADVTSARAGLLLGTELVILAAALGAGALVQSDTVGKLGRRMAGGMSALMLLPVLLILLYGEWDGGWWQTGGESVPAAAWRPALALAGLGLTGSLWWVALVLERQPQDGSGLQAWFAWAAVLLGVAALSLVSAEPDWVAQRALGHLYKSLAVLVIYAAVLVEGLRERRLLLNASEQKLKEKDAQYQQLFASTPDALLLVDGQGRIETVNPAVLRLFGWAERELIGQPVEVLMPTRHRHMHEQHRERFLASGKSREMGEGRELFARRKDGSEFFVEVALVPQPAQDGQKRTLAILRDASRQKTLERVLKHQASHDGLTDLCNRHRLLEVLGLAMSLPGASLSLVCIDLDGFKGINDNYGHTVGDWLLKEVGQRLQQAVSPADTVARIGGDEFAVLVPRALDREARTQLIVRLQSVLQARMRMEDHELNISASVGVARFPEDAQTPESLLGCADLAMNRAKGAQRGAWLPFDPEMLSHARERLVLEKGLRQAIARGEFELHYQPRVQAADASLAGFEALLRWNHPEQGRVPPDRFIPVAESTGQIEAIGEWVLREACRQAARWNLLSTRRTVMAVNVSARQLQRPDFADLVKRVLQETGLPPELLELELTETALMEDQAVTASALQALADHGVGTAIDDFGTGYSSLAYLQAFALRRLKVDRSFVKGLEDNAHDRALTSTIIVLAHTLGLDVTAEGVETAAQVACLQALGCDELQGYYFARPMPAGECEALLRMTAR